MKAKEERAEAKAIEKPQTATEDTIPQRTHLRETKNKIKKKLKKIPRNEIKRETKTEEKIFVRDGKKCTTRP